MQQSDIERQSDKTLAKKWAVFVTWEELYGKSPTEDEVWSVLRTFNRESTVTLLARIGTHLAIDQFREKTDETIYLQRFLVSNFLDQEVQDRCKEKMPNERIDFRRPFHSQQVLTAIKWAILQALPDGGLEPDKDADARFALGRCLLKTNDLLMTRQMASNIARDRHSRPTVKKYLRLQLELGPAYELFNPAPVPTAIVRSQIVFEDLVNRVPTAIDLNNAFERESGITLQSYVDLTFGVLTHYLGRNPSELFADAGLALVNPEKFFVASTPTETNERFWATQERTINDTKLELSKSNDLIPQKDFIAFRAKPFLKLSSGSLICPNPGFLQEKLERGLFWTIVNHLEGDARKLAFDAWGALFERYVNEILEKIVEPPKERYFSHPNFKHKKHHHESFDGFLMAGRVCAPIECKGGFLPSNAKYGDELDRFIEALDNRFGTLPGAGVEQLVRKISQIFGTDPAKRRELEGIDLTDVRIIVPVLVVQENFASSMFTAPWLAKSFRDLLRKKSLIRGIVVTSLLVLHVEDVESIQTYIARKQFSVNECLLHAGKCGDPGSSGRLFEFSDLFREFLESKQVGPISSAADDRFRAILDRVCQRFFNHKFDG